MPCTNPSPGRTTPAAGGDRMIVCIFGEQLAGGGAGLALQGRAEVGALPGGGRSRRAHGSASPPHRPRPRRLGRATLAASTPGMPPAQCNAGSRPHCHERPRGPPPRLQSAGTGSRPRPRPPRPWRPRPPGAAAAAAAWVPRETGRGVQPRPGRLRAPAALQQVTALPSLSSRHLLLLLRASAWKRQGEGGSD